MKRSMAAMPIVAMPIVVVQPGWYRTTGVGRCSDRNRAKPQRRRYRDARVQRGGRGRPHPRAGRSVGYVHGSRIPRSPAAARHRRNPRGIGNLGSVGARKGIVKPGTLKYAEGRKGGFDPHARIVNMDAYGIDAAFLYSVLGAAIGWNFGWSPKSVTAVGGQRSSGRCSPCRSTSCGSRRHDG
jgi:hypothetical protein